MVKDCMRKNSKKYILRQIKGIEHELKKVCPDKKYINQKVNYMIAELKTKSDAKYW